ncbi:hypothetical protein DFH27DRAFT_650947 [Peziza echinospora]|nr:hypothetical protein DFH27DRAFT_650947 [Peziza echinospora]
MSSAISATPPPPARSSAKRPHTNSPNPNNSSYPDESGNPASSSSPSSTSAAVSHKRQKTPDYRNNSGVGSESALPTDFFDTGAGAGAAANSHSAAMMSTVLPIGGGNNVRQHRGGLEATAGGAGGGGDAVDEDEWAAFEADIAEVEESSVPPATTTHTIAHTSILPPNSSGSVISAAPTGPGSGATNNNGNLDSVSDRAGRDEDAQLDREDAQNKLAEEFDEMEGLEGRVRRLKEQREALRVKARDVEMARMEVVGHGEGGEGEDEVDEDEDEDDEGVDDWIHFRRG